MPGLTRLHWRQSARAGTSRQDCFFSWGRKPFPPSTIRRQPLFSKNCFRLAGKKGTVLSVASNPLLPALPPTPVSDFSTAASVASSGHFLVRPASFAATKNRNFPMSLLKTIPPAGPTSARPAAVISKPSSYTGLTHPLYLAPGGIRHRGFGYLIGP